MKTASFNINTGTLNMSCNLSEFTQDNLVSKTDDKTGVISELLDIQLEEDVSASVQPLDE